MKKPKLSRIFNFNRSEMKIIPLIGVSLIIFIVTVAVYFVANYVAESYVDDSRLSNWEYYYTDQPGVVPDAELRIYNAQNPILTEKDVRKDYIYFTKSLEASDTSDKLIIKTDFSPIMIRVNGREVYNNFESDYVGNCYNSTVIEGSTQERQIEVFMKLPLSVRFEAFLSGGETDTAFTPTFGFVLGVIMTAAGLLALIVFAVLSLIKKKPYNSLLTSFIFAYTGFALVLHCLPEVTYLLNEPIWLRIIETSVHLTFVLTLFGLNHYFKNHRKTAAAVLIVTVISAAAMLLSGTPLLIRVSSAVMCILTSAAIVYSASLCLYQIGKRMQYSVPIFVMNVYYAMASLLAAVFLLARQRNLYIFTLVIPTVSLLCVMEYLFIADYRFQKKNSSLPEQSVRYSEEVDGVSRFIHNMLHPDKGAGFYERAADEITDLLIKHRQDNSDVCCCAAERNEDGGYREIINRGCGRCDYPVIEKCAAGSGRNCIVTETYFDYILRNDGKVGAIFHFENVKGGLDVFFNSITEAAYCGLEAAYKTESGKDKDGNIITVLNELADNAELDHGGSAGHISRIYTHSLALCKELGMDEEQANKTALAAMLHDLGKIAIPSFIINKEGMLSEEERLTIRSHADFGYKILSAFDDDPVLMTAATIARYHHERYDGSGYNGLQGEEIPVEARIVTVCDVYDALVSERVYKKAWSREDAIDYLKENEGKIFDPKICGAFIAYVSRD